MADKNVEKMSTNDPSEKELIEVYRETVKKYYERHLYQSAEFWADKLVCLSNDADDIYLHAQCLFHLKQYHRAAHVIISRNMHKTSSLCYYVASLSLLEAKEYKNALSILDCDDTEDALFSSTMIDDTGLPKTGPGVPRELQSSILLLKARVLQANGNRGRAADCYTAALMLDVRCYEAFEALVQHQMLPSAEEKKLLRMLPLRDQCSEEEASVLRGLYYDQLKKYAEPAKERPLEQPATDDEDDEMESCDASMLAESLDCKAWRAERLYYNCDYHLCHQLTTEIWNKDPYHHRSLPVHIGCLVQFRKSNDLFQLSHKLVKLYPEVAISWYSVGCFYFVIGKSDPARRYLNKATMLDPLFGPAWLAYGHSFAAENEHDQAMAAYFRASQLMRGCHLPLLYVGLECGLTNNIKLAEKFFGQAHNIAPKDPYVMHEMGVIAFQNEEWVEARGHFTAALQRIKQVDSRRLEEAWEPLLNNLGHVCRKLGDLDNALMYHQQALTLKPLTGSTYAAIGFVQMLLGDMASAVDAFHEALSLRHDDTFSTTMLNSAMEALVNSSLDSEPFIGAPSELPSFQTEFASPQPAATITPSVDTPVAAECEMQDDSNP